MDLPALGSSSLPTSTHQQPTATLRHLLNRMVTNAEAATTRKHRNDLWNRMIRWATARALPTTQETAMLFSLQHARKASSKRNYFSALCARLNPQPQKNLFIKALAKQAKAEPLTQARIVSQTQAHRYITEAPIAIQPALQLLWRTASRTADVTSLKRSNITLAKNRKLISIHWKDVKTTGDQPYKLQFYTRLQVRHNNPLDTALMQWIARTPQTRLMVTTPQLNAIRRYLRSLNLTDHSIKRSAITAAARNLISKYNLANNENLHLLPAIREALRILAKHESINSTIRYIGNPELTAILTGVATLTATL